MQRVLIIISSVSFAQTQRFHIHSWIGSTVNVTASRDQYSPREGG